MPDQSHLGRSSQHISSAVIRVRALWAGPAAPDLGEVLTPDALADEQLLADILTADVEERRRRGIAAPLERYVEHHEALREQSAACRAVLMAEAAARTAEPIDAIRRDFLGRFPSLAQEVNEVMELAEFLREAVADGAPLPRGSGVPLGKYVLRAPLGSGAFGEVWQAWDTELQRHVALKILHNAHHSGTRGVQRFLSEARAAASLSHEAVVHVHAAGQFEQTGEYYIDSQLVGDPAPTPEDPAAMQPGDSLQRRIAGGPMQAGEAARIMLVVARGVAAAHARGITHRDIKPENILLTPSGRPLIADFGLSTSGLLARGQSTPTVPQRSAPTGRIVGTPAYMSPEQARGEPATPLSDVFSLGATLRALLTGRPPYEPSGTANADPRSEVMALARSGTLTPLAQLCPDLPRTLCSIADRATASDPGARYGSAEQLATDLDAFLNHRPTLASNPGVGERLRLWCIRHRLATVIAMVAMVVIVGGTALFIQRLTTERDRALVAEMEAKAKRDQIETINQFLARTLNSTRGLGLGRDITVSQAFRLASSRVGVTFADEPLIEAGVRHLLGQAALGTSEYEEAQRQLQRALELRMAQLGPEAHDTLLTRRQLGELARAMGKFDDAEAIMKDIVGPLERVAGLESPDTLRASAFLGYMKMRRKEYDEARAILERAVDGFRRTRQYGSADQQGVMNWLSSLYSYRHELDKTIEVNREIVALNEANLGRDDISTLNASWGLAYSLLEARKRAEAETLLRSLLDRYRATVGPGHIYTLQVEVSLSDLLLNQRKEIPYALTLADQVIADSSSHGRSNNNELQARTLRGRALAALRRGEEAEAALNDALDRSLAKHGKTHRYTRDAARSLISLYERANRKPDADAVCARIATEVAPEPSPEP